MGLSELFKKPYFIDVGRKTNDHLQLVAISHASKLWSIGGPQTDGSDLRPILLLSNGTAMELLPGSPELPTTVLVHFSDNNELGIGSETFEFTITFEQLDQLARYADSPERNAIIMPYPFDDIRLLPQGRTGLIDQETLNQAACQNVLIIKKWCKSRRQPLIPHFGFIKIRPDRKKNQLLIARTADILAFMEQVHEGQYDEGQLPVKMQKISLFK